MVLANLLPGLREIRAPVVSGYLWLAFLFLALHSTLPSRRGAGPAIQPIFDLGDRLSAFGLAAVTGVAAYLVGSAMQEVLKSAGRRLAPRRPFYAEPGIHTTQRGREVLMGSLEVRMDGITRRLFQIALSPGERGIEEAPAEDAILDELPLTRALLLGGHPELVGELDRLQAEADLRITVSAPLAALATLLFVQTSDLWWLLILIPAGLLLWQGYRRQHEAGDFLAKILRLGKVDAPVVKAFEVSVDAALERNELEWQLRGEMNDGDAGAAFRLGNLQASAGENEEALGALRLAAERGVSRAYAEMGLLYELLEDVSEAEKVFRDGAKRGDRKASDLLAVLLSSQSRDEEALVAVEEAHEGDVGEVATKTDGPPSSERSRLADYRRRIDAGDAKAAINLGLLLRRQSDLEGAIDAFREATRLDEGDREAWFYLGLVSDLQAQFVDARTAYERALEIEERDLGPDHLEVATTLGNLGSILGRLGDYEKARLLEERALGIKEEELGADHLRVASTVGRLAAALLGLGDYEEARRQQERALKITERGLGPDHMDVARILANLGIAWGGLGNYEKALALEERALGIKERELGPDHLETATTLNILAGTLARSGDYEKARGLVERALKIRERDLGVDHLEVADCLDTHGEVMLGSGEPRQALESWERALSIREQQLGPGSLSSAETLCGLGNARRALGDLRGSEAAFRLAQTIFEGTPSSPASLAFLLRGLARTLHMAGRLAEARETIERAIAIQEKAVGRNQSELAKSLEVMAEIRGDLGETEAADRAGEQAQSIRKENGPEKRG